MRFISVTLFVTELEYWGGGHLKEKDFIAHSSRIQLFTVKENKATET